MQSTMTRHVCIFSWTLGLEKDLDYERASEDEMTFCLACLLRHCVGFHCLVSGVPDEAGLYSVEQQTQTVDTMILRKDTVT